MTRMAMESSNPSSSNRSKEAANHTAPRPQSFVILEDGARRKKRRIVSPHSSAAVDDNQNEMACAWTSMHGMWKAMPKEILDTIQSLLPFSSQHRFRSVCQKWNRAALSLLPPLMMLSSELSRRGDQNAKFKFFYEPENKWFNLPFGMHHCLPCPTVSKKPQREVEMMMSEMHVIDVEGGLVCYQTERFIKAAEFNIFGQVNIFGPDEPISDLWVFNPLKNSVSGPFHVPNSRREIQCSRFLRAKAKLIVDKKTKDFKLLLPGHRMSTTRGSTKLFQVQTDLWDFSNLQVRADLYLRLFELFTWENVVYAYSTEVHRGVQENQVAAYDVLLDRWTYFSAKIPVEPHVPTRHLIVSYNQQVLLVLCSARRRKKPYISVWKLLDEGLDFGTRMSAPWENWEQIPLESSLESKKGLDFSSHLLAQACLGAESICFIFRDFKAVKKEKEREWSRAYLGNSYYYRYCSEDTSEESPKCLRYSFAKRSWTVMNYPEGWTGDLRVYNWEPSLLITSPLQ